MTRGEKVLRGLGCKPITEQTDHDMRTMHLGPGQAYQISIRKLLPDAGTLWVIHPSAAATILEFHQHPNRGVKERIVNELVEVIRTGDWQIAAGACLFTKGGQWIDGQHRLAACAKSGCAVVLHVFFDVDADVIIADQVKANDRKFEFVLRLLPRGTRQRYTIGQISDMTGVCTLFANPLTPRRTTCSTMTAREHLRLFQHLEPELGRTVSSFAVRSDGLFAKNVGYAAAYLAGFHIDQVRLQQAVAVLCGAEPKSREVEVFQGYRAAVCRKHVQIRKCGSVVVHSDDHTYRTLFIELNLLFAGMASGNLRGVKLPELDGSKEDLVAQWPRFLSLPKRKRHERIWTPAK